MSVQRKRKRTRLPKGERRAQILGAALRAFVVRGYHRTHVDHIIEEASVARGTFYLHFESKHEVFKALVDSMLHVFIFSTSVVGDEPALYRRETCEKSLRAHYRALVTAVWENRQLCRLFLEEAAGIDQDFAQTVERHRHAWFERVHSRITDMQRTGLVRKDVDPVLSAWGIVGMGEMVLRKYALGPRVPDHDKVAKALAAADLRGILNQA